jgi:pimeloyl-ACP methyl ester carboxylesterase
MPWFEYAESRIYFEDEGDGTPILLLPGLTQSIDELAPLRAQLSSGFRVIAADLPGSGKSLPQPRDYTPRYYHDDAEAFLALLEQFELGPVHVAGFSDGGEVALLMAVNNSRALRSVVVWGAAGQVAIPSELIEGFHNLIDAPSEAMREFSQRLVASYGEAVARSTVQSAAAAWRTIVATGGDISRAGAADISSPLLLITGEHDPFAPPAVVKEFANAVTESEFVQVDGAGHVLDQDGVWLGETILRWIRNHEP